MASLSPKLTFENLLSAFRSNCIAMVSSPLLKLFFRLVYTPRGERLLDCAVMAFAGDVTFLAFVPRIIPLLRRIGEWLISAKTAK
jgi:hypothetical protein